MVEAADRATAATMADPHQTHRTMMFRLGRSPLEPEFFCWATIRGTPSSLIAAPRNSRWPGVAGGRVSAAAAGIMQAVACRHVASGEGTLHAVQQVVSPDRGTKHEPALDYSPCLGGDDQIALRQGAACYGAGENSA